MGIGRRQCEVAEQLSAIHNMLLYPHLIKSLLELLRFFRSGFRQEAREAVVRLGLRARIRHPLEVCRRVERLLKKSEADA